MKKVFFTIFLTFFSVICVNAQEIDSLQIKSDTISTFYPSICQKVMGLDAMILVFLNVEF